MSLKGTTSQLSFGVTDYSTTINSIAPTADRIATIPALSANDTFTFIAQSQVLTNKTISGANNTLSNIGNSSRPILQLPSVRGTGLSGGGTVALGGTISLANAGVTSISENGASLTGAVVIAAGGINTITNSGQTITITGTEADTLQSVTTRAATSTTLDFIKFKSVNFI